MSKEKKKRKEKKEAVALVIWYDYFSFLVD